MEIIKLTNITKIYGKGTSQTVALKNVNLSINQGEFLSVMGPSGSGKSTLLNILGCMDISTKGEYYLKGELVNKCSRKKLGEIRNSIVSFVFQHFALMKDYTVFENVELPLNCRKVSARKRKESVLKYLEKLGIADLAKKPALCDFHVTSDKTRSVGIDIDLTMTKGSVTVELVNPQGKTVWSSTVKDGEHLKKSLNFSAVKGKWQFLTYDKGTPEGKYTVSFKQKYL